MSKEHKKYKYKRVCSECGDVSLVWYKPKPDQLCSTCSGKVNGKRVSQNNIKDDKDRSKYNHLCLNCYDIKRTYARRKSVYCGTCSKTFSKKEIKKYTFDYKDMTMRLISLPPVRLVQICEVCGNSKIVKSKRYSGITTCVSCKNKAKREAAAMNPKKYKRKKTYSPVGTDGAKENKVKIIMKKEKSPVKRTEDEMIAEFLNNKKVTVIQSNFNDDFTTGCKVNLASGY